MSAIEVRGAARAFGSGRRARVALQECSFSADAGEIVGVVGPNGAGKTTLLRLVAGEIPLSSGMAWVDGYRVGTRMARLAVGYASDPPLLPPELTGLEWLKYLAGHRAAHPGKRTSLVRWAVGIGELESFGSRRIGEYSRGMAQRLALAAASITGRVAIILDEALNGIDPLVAGRLRGRIADLAASGKVIVVASHDLATVEKLATRVLVLWEGRLSADVDVARLVQERVAELSLGGSALARTEALVQRFPDAVRTGEGVAIPLSGGLTIEKVLAACRAARVAVAASRVRYRALEDILHAAAASHGRESL